MTTRPTSVTELSGTLSLSTYRNGIWLYDKTRGMNLAMRATTEREALVNALQYYQRRLTNVEQKYDALKEKVDAFVDKFKEDES